MNEALFDQATSFAFARLREGGGDVMSLPVPLQTVVVVVTAQGIIDNGGLGYFYESDFPRTPSYEFFVSAYRRIGAESAASCIETTAAMFPFLEPHLHEARRGDWLDKVRDDENHLFVKLSDKICGDRSVFLKLAQYVEANRKAFGLP